MKTGKDMPGTIKYYYNNIKEKRKRIFENNYFGEF
jgi:hypothetical protein